MKRFFSIASFCILAALLTACETGSSRHASSDGISTRPAPANGSIKVSGYSATSVTTTR